MRGESDIGLMGLLSEKIQNRPSILGSVTGNQSEGSVSITDAVLHRQKPLLTALGQRLSTPANVPLGTQYPVETALSKRFPAPGTPSGDLSPDTQNPYSLSGTVYPNDHVLANI